MIPIDCDSLLSPNGIAEKLLINRDPVSDSESFQTAHSGPHDSENEDLKSDDEKNYRMFTFKRSLISRHELDDGSYIPELNTVFENIQTKFDPAIDKNHKERARGDFPTDDDFLQYLKDRKDFKRRSSISRRAFKENRNIASELAKKVQFESQNDYSILVNKLESTTSECNSALSQVSENKRFVERMAMQMDNMEVQAIQLENINEKLEKKMEFLTNEYLEIVNQCHHLQSDNVRLKDSLVEAYATNLSEKALSFSSLDLFGASYDDQIKDFKEKNDKLKSELLKGSSMQREINCNFRIFKSLMNDRLNDITDQLTTCKTNYQTKIMEKNLTISQLSEALETQKLNSLEKENTLQNQISILENEIKNYEHSAAQNNAKYTELSEKLNHIQSQDELQMNEMKASLAKIHDLTEDLENEKKLNSDLSTQLSNEKLTIQGLNEKIVKRKSNYDIKYNAALQEIKKVSEEKTQLLSKNDELSKQYTASMEKNSKNEIELKKALHAAVAEVKSKEKSLKEAAKNASALEQQLDLFINSQKEIDTCFLDQAKNLDENQESFKHIQENVNNQNAQKVALTFQISKMTEDINNTHGLLNQSALQIKNLNEMIQCLELENQCKDKLISESNKCLKIKTERLLLLEKELSEFETQFKEAFSIHTDIASSINGTNSEISGLKDSQQQDKRKFMIISDQLKHLVKEHELLHVENATLSTEIHEKNCQISELKEDIDDKKLRILNLNEDLSFKNSIISDLENEINANFAKLSDATKTLEALSKSLAKTTSEKKDLIDESNSLWNQIKELKVNSIMSGSLEDKEALENLKLADEENRNAINSLKETVQSFNDEIEYQSITIEELRKANRRLKYEKESLESSVDNNSMEHDQLCIDKRELEVKYSAKIKESERQLELIEILEARHNEANEKLDQFKQIQKEKEMLQLENSKLKNLVIQSQSYIENLKLEMISWKEHAANTNYDSLKTIEQQYFNVLHEHNILKDQMSKLMDKSKSGLKIDGSVKSEISNGDASIQQEHISTDPDLYVSIDGKLSSWKNDLESCLHRLDSNALKQLPLSLNEEKSKVIDSLVSKINECTHQKSNKPNDAQESNDNESSTIGRPRSLSGPGILVRKLHSFKSSGVNSIIRKLKRASQGSEATLRPDASTSELSIPDQKYKIQELEQDNYQVKSKEFDREYQSIFQSLKGDAFDQDSSDGLQIESVTNLASLMGKMVDKISTNESVISANVESF